MWFIRATSENWISRHPTLTPRTRLGSSLQASPPGVPCPRRPLFHQPYCISLIMNFRPSRVLSSVLRGHSPTPQSFACKHLSLCCVSLAKHQLPPPAALGIGRCWGETERGQLCCLDIYDHRSHVGPQLCWSMLPNSLINSLSHSARWLCLPQVS